MIIDASVALRWLLPSRRTEAAVAAVEGETLAAPFIFPAEVGHALTKQVRRGLLTSPQASVLWRELLNAPIRVAPFQEPEAVLELSLLLHASFYDACYLALALGEGDVLLTSDGRFARGVRARPELTPHIIILEGD